MDKDKAIRSAKLTAAGILDKARARTAVTRAGGQIAPSKYLPDVPRQVHAGGGKVALMQGNHPLVPDVLYHGTARDIQSFDPNAKRSYDVDPSNPEETDTGWFGKGHYFTASPKLAAHYADEGAKRQGGQGANIIPAHVAMKNPFVVDMKAYDSGAKSLDNALSRAGVPMHTRGWRKPSEQTAALVGMGHDGVIATREGKPEEYVAFHPNQIKSAIGNQGTFDPNNPDITKAGGGRINANGGGKMELRSKAAEAIRNQPQLKGSVDQLLAVASKGKGVKQAELANAGRPTGNIISKEQLAQHFENAVPQVQVEKYGDIAPVGHTEDEKKEYNHLSAERLFGKADENQLRRLRELEDKTKTKSDSTYGKWTLPVGKNYREHLLHLPPKGGDVTHKVTGAFPRDFDTEAEAHAYIDQMNRAAEEPGMETIRDNLRQYPLTYSPEGGFHSSHWSVPNVIAHVRMKDLNRGDDLFVQEVQSDWGQNGREQGFYDPKNPYEVVRKGTKEVVSKHPDYSSMWDAYRTHPDSDNLNYGDVRGEKVPNGAYVGNTQQWTDLALKHVLTEAAKGGHKRVVFAPGEANADLYGQRTKITQATLKPMPDKPEMLGELYGWDKDTGEQIDHGPISDEKELASALGKKHAQALLAQPMVRNSHRSLIDPSMVLGGHGMVDYYSNIVHPSALKLLQQHDPSIQPEKPYALPGQEGTDSDYKGLSLPMTETARQSILKNGFGAFKRGGTVGKEEGGAVDAALALTRRFTKDGTGATMALKPKGK